MRERAPQKYMYFQVSNCICIHNTINAVVWHYKWQYDWQNTNIEGKNYEYASERERASLEKVCIYLF